MLRGMARSLVVKATAGADSPERCSQAFTVAATAVAGGVPTSLWLTGESAWFALPGRAATFDLAHAAPLPDLLDAVLVGPDDVLPGIRIAGAATFVEEALAEGAQALVY